MNDVTPVLDALGDATRRQVLDRLRSGPRSVSELAAGLPVSRPAVSQHLRVLREAGLVTSRRDGTRQLYRLERAGLEVLRTYVESFWDDVFAAFSAAATERAAQAAEETPR